MFNNIFIEISFFRIHIKYFVIIFHEESDEEALMSTSPQTAGERSYEYTVTNKRIITNGDEHITSITTDKVFTGLRPSYHDDIGCVWLETFWRNTLRISAVIE